MRCSSAEAVFQDGVHERGIRLIEKYRKPLIASLDQLHERTIFDFECVFKAQQCG